MIRAILTAIFECAILLSALAAIWFAIMILGAPT